MNNPNFSWVKYLTERDRKNYCADMISKIESVSGKKISIHSLNTMTFVEILNLIYPNND